MMLSRVRISESKNIYAYKVKRSRRNTKNNENNKTGWDDDFRKSCLLVCAVSFLRLSGFGVDPFTVQ